ncbi:MAG: hypothetical protein IJT94_01395 [Oscillibacter sp.]|nr:hypothetical protein [Oscillibacter sp.]
MKRQRFRPSGAGDRSSNPALKIASGAFFIAFFAYSLGALLSFVDGVEVRGTVLLMLAAANLCLSLVYGRLWAPGVGARRGIRGRRHQDGKKGRQSWHS